MTKKLFTDAEILNLRTLFKQADKDDSGSISPEEAKQCLNKFGIKNLKVAQIDQLIKKVDTNSSGSIEFVEFMKFANFAKLEENLEEPKVKERGLSRSVSPIGGVSPMQSKRAVFKLIKGFVKEQQDVLGWADPFVVIKIGVAERKSKVIKNQQNPVWNEQLIFGDVSVKEATDVKIQLWDWDKLSNDIIGTGTLSLPQYERNKQTVKVPILSDGGAEKGWVEMEVELVSGGEYMATVKIVDGEVYERHDTFGWADPYVVLKIGANEQKSVEKKNAKTPVWNEEFTFNGISKHEAGNITVTMWDWEKVGEHDLIGSGKLDLLPYLNNKQKIKVVFIDPHKKKKKPEQGHANLEVFLETEPTVLKEREFVVRQQAEDALRLVSEDEANKQRSSDQAALAAKERELAEALEAARKAKADAEAAQAAAERARASSEKAEAEANKAKEDADREKEEARLAREAAEKARAEAEKEKEDAKNAKDAAENAKAAAEKAKEDADREKEETRVAREAAEKEKEDAKNAKDAAENAKAAAEKAKEDAEKARAEAEKEKEDAKNAKDAAEKEKEDAKRAKEDVDREKEEARLARKAADKARAEAEKKKEDAKNAKDAAENEKAAAEKAEAEAEAAKGEAAKAKEDAEKAKVEAEAAKAAAEKEKEEAEVAKAEAAKAKEDAEKAVADAKRLQEEAEQAAEKAKAEVENAQAAERKAKEEEQKAKDALAEKEKENAALDAKVKELEKQIDDLKREKVRVLVTVFGGEEQEDPSVTFVRLPASE